MWPPAVHQAGLSVLLCLAWKEWPGGKRAPYAPAHRTSNPVCSRTAKNMSGPEQKWNSLFGAHIRVDSRIHAAAEKAGAAAWTRRKIPLRRYAKRPSHFGSPARSHAAIFPPRKASDHSSPAVAFCPPRSRRFQRRLVTLMAHAKARDWPHADEVPQMESALKDAATRSPRPNASPIPLHTVQTAVFWRSDHPPKDVWPAVLGYKTL